MEALWQDLRYCARMLWKNRSFTAVAVIALALGIGANTAIFSVINAVLLRPLPYKDPDRLVMMWEYNPRLQLGFDEIPASVANYFDWRTQNNSFESVAGFWPYSYNITDGTEPERLEGVRVSASLFPMLGIQPSIGRGFLPTEEQYGNHREVILSNGLWQRRFGADRQLIGKTLQLNGESFTVVGIAPPDFQFARRTELPPELRFFPAQADLWTPLAFPPDEAADRGTRNVAVIGRLKPNVALSQAEADMKALTSRLAGQYPKTNKGFGALLVPLHQQTVGRAKPALLILFGAVGFVLLIACANVANLLLARAAARRKEIAVRAALGASRLRLIRQFLTESTALALLGGLLGLLPALWGIDLLLAFMPDNLPRITEARLDGRVAAFTFGISLLTGIIFSIAPALQASKPDLNESLKEGSRGSGSGFGRNRLRSLLVISETALALVLLVGAGLMIRSFMHLLQVSPGFDPQHVLTAEIALPQSKYPESDQQAAFFSRYLERMAASPGVESAALSTSLPFTGSESSTGVTIEGRPKDQQASLSDYVWASPNFFRTMGIPILKGRDFTERDGKDTKKAVIISETFARRFFPNEDPMGKRISVSLEKEVKREIVAVVGDVKYSALNAEPMPALYIPHLQGQNNFMFLVARSASDPMSIAAVARKEAQAIDKDLPIANAVSMEQLLSSSLKSQRFNMLLLVLFAAVALLLACVGIYGVLSYMVTQRMQEIGIRIALGAQPRDILKMVAAQGMALTLIGIVVGIAGAAILTRLMSSLLYGVSASDPITYGIISLLLATSAMLACYIPARRATKVDPIVALRYE